MKISFNCTDDQQVLHTHEDAGLSDQVPCSKPDISPEAYLNDYRNRMPFHYIEEGSDGYYYWQYGSIMDLVINFVDEIAQSEAYLGHKWCNYWFHILHLNTNSGKMSKSKGEFLTVSLLEEKGYKPVIYRFFCLLSHYRKSLVFSWENLDNAVVAYNKLVEKIAPLTKEQGGDIDKAEYDRLMKSFTDALDNDVNTAMGITVLYDVLKSKANAATKLALIAEFDKVLGLDLITNAKELSENAGAASADIPAEVMELVEQRKAARKDKNFALADELRDKIAALGYEVKETRQGTEINKI